MLLWPFNKYPGTDYETFNWEWLINLGKKMEKALHDLFSDTGALHQMVDKVLGEHPNWTTTVMNGAISTAKLMDEAVTREKLSDNISDYIEDAQLNYNMGRFDTYSGNRSTVYYAKIPASWKPELSIANDMIDTVEDPSRNAYREHSTVSINAGLFDLSTNETHGYVIQDKIVLKNTDYINGATGAAYIYMEDDGTLGSVPEGTTLSSIIANHDPEWLVRGWYPIVENGVYVAGGHDPNPSDNQRSWIAQDNNGNYLVACCGAREKDDIGMSMLDIYHWLVDDMNFDVRFAYSLDGGASSSLIVDNIRVNMVTDAAGVRPVANYIQFRKPEIKIKNASETGTAASKTLAWYGRYMYNHLVNKVEIDKKFAMITDCDIEETGFYTFSDDANNSPCTGYTGIMIVLHDSGNTVQQIAISRGLHMYSRQIYHPTGNAPVIEPWVEYGNTRGPISESVNQVAAGTVSVNRVYRSGASICVYYRMTLNADVPDYGTIFTLNGQPNPYMTIPDKFYINGTINTGNGYFTTSGSYNTRTPLTAGQEVTIVLRYVAIQ